MQLNLTTTKPKGRQHTSICQFTDAQTMIDYLDVFVALGETLRKVQLLDDTKKTLLTLDLADDQSLVTQVEEVKRQVGQALLRIGALRKQEDQVD